MYTLFERVERTEQCPYGSKQVKGNPFLEGPCFLCVTPMYYKPIAKYSYGASKMAMQLARLRVKGKHNAGYDVKGFPVKFLSILAEERKGKKDTSQERMDMFLEDYFFPLISDNGQKIDIDIAKKRMRNVNMATYCNGTLFFTEVEIKLMEKMLELGYTRAEADEIIKQLCIITFSTNCLTKQEKATCISFTDINDDIVNDNVTDEEKRIVHQEGEKLVEHSNNEIEYMYNGYGNHEFKKYGEDSLTAACVTSVIYRALQNSIENARSDSFTPISARNVNIKYSRNIKSSKKNRKRRRYNG